ncbi:MAG: M28 family peptidase [Promethearchaeota archaeon]
MQIDEVIASVDVERLYKHLCAIEGSRNPLKTPESLERTASYILTQFEQYGLSVNKQEFNVEGFDGTFYNIEGIIGDGAKPELLVTSHYDTVENSPGADDNGSAVAVMLESARVLAESEWSGHARFISFSLEEGNPAMAARVKVLARKHGVTDEKARYTSWRTTKLMKRYARLRRGMVGFKRSEAMAKVRAQLQDQLSHNELQYLKGLETLYEDVTITSWPGQTSLLGSGFWVKDAMRSKKQIIGVLNLEMVGYTSKTEHSQRYPEGIPTELFKTYGTDESLTVGDFLTVVGDRNSERLAESFYTQCQRGSIDLPYAGLQGEFSFEQIAQIMPDILRSDHAPFWRAEIPALMLTDSAEFRTPYYHTAADTISTLDFDFMLKVCKAVIATTVDLASI